MKAASFGKGERLKRRKQIDALFTQGRSLVQYPVRLKYQLQPLVEGAVPVLAGVSASRKTFKRAVDRTRIKRLLREAYRLQKAPLLQAVAATNLQVVLFLIFTDKSLPRFDVVYKAVGSCLEGLRRHVIAQHENAH